MEYNKKLLEEEKIKKLKNERMKQILENKKHLKEEDYGLSI